MQLRSGMNLRASTGSLTKASALLEGKQTNTYQTTILVH
jgi:hypothetical protein